MSRVSDAMIVAGGRGTRLRPLTDTTPKPLLPVGGRPFLSGVIRRLAEIGVERVLLVVGPNTAPFDVLRRDAALVGVTVEAVPEPTPLDTAGGVRAALDRVRGTFLVLNGDILTGLDLGDLVARHVARGAAATLALTRVQDTSAFGVCVLDGDRIVDFVEKPPPGALPGQDAINAGTYVLEPAAMADFPAGPLSFERRVFPDLVASGQAVHGLVSEAVWTDLGTPQGFQRGHRMILDGEVDWPHPDGAVRTPGPATADDVHVAESARLRGPVQIGRGSRISPGAQVGPYVVLGENVTIGDDVRIRDSVVFDGCSIGARSLLAGVLLGRGANIGEEVVATEGAVVGDDQHVPARRQLAADSRLPAADDPDGTAP